MIDPCKMARDIVNAEDKNDMPLYRDLWEEVAANSGSLNRLYEAVEREVENIKESRRIDAMEAAHYADLGIE